jgi:radical SAM enzyme (TIGR01210 family)
VIISNNGSVFDRETFAKRALQHLLVQTARNLPNVRTLTLESRPEYVRRAELEFISRLLSRIGSSMRVEIAVGFEAFDDHIRNEVYNKGLSLAEFERFIGTLAPFGYRVKCYLMHKPAPGMTDREAVTDIHRAMDYLGRIAGIYGIGINIHINPTYVAAGTMLEQAFREGRYQPPMLCDVADAARHARGKPFSVFIGLTDEGLAIEHGSFIRGGDELLLQRLEQFNRTQDFDVLDRARGSVCKTSTTEATTTSPIGQGGTQSW